MTVGTRVEGLCSSGNLDLEDKCSFFFVPHKKDWKMGADSIFLCFRSSGVPGVPAAVPGVSAAVPGVPAVPAAVLGVPAAVPVVPGVSRVCGACHYVVVVQSTGSSHH